MCEVDRDIFSLLLLLQSIYSIMSVSVKKNILTDKLTFTLFECGLTTCIVSSGPVLHSFLSDFSRTLPCMMMCCAENGIFAGFAFS